MSASPGGSAFPAKDSAGIANNMIENRNLMALFLRYFVCDYIGIAILSVLSKSPHDHKSNDAAIPIMK